MSLSRTAMPSKHTHNRPSHSSASEADTVAALPAVRRIDILSLDDIRDIEQGRYEEVVPFRSTAAILEYVARAHGPAPALRYQVSADPGDSPLTWSFEQLWENVLKAAGLFRSLGIRRGDPVALLVPHVPSAHFALWGAQLAGCAFPINFLLSAEHIAQLLKATNTRVVVTLAAAAQLPINAQARRAAELAGCVEHVLEIDPDERTPAPGSFQHRMQQHDGTGDFLSGLDRDSLAALFHTGGTTGLPKILRHSHGNEVHTSWFGAMYYGMKAGDLILNGFPMFHVAGTFVYGLAPLAAGAALFLPTLAGMRNQDFVRKAWIFAEKHGITHLGCVPTVLSALLAVPKEAGQAESVRLALTGGSPLPNELAAKFEEVHRIPVRNIFGMTECAGIVSIEPFGSGRRPGSAGIRLPFSEAAAVPLAHTSDDTLSAFCRPGEPGVIVIRGPHVSDGYIDASRNRGTFTRDGWLISGDLGYIDEDGYLYLTGRSKDLIIRGGHNIEPGLVEDAFLRHPAVGTCAVVGEPDSYAGELPVAFVTLKGETDADPGSILVEAARHIPERPALPKKVVILDQLPTTPVGKIYKPALRALAAREKIRELLAALALADAVQVECTAEAGGIVATLGTQSLSADELGALKQALTGLPVQLQFLRSESR